MEREKERERERERERTKMCERESDRERARARAHTHEREGEWELIRFFWRVFFGGYCSTVQDLLDWFEVDLGFTKQASGASGSKWERLATVAL